MYTYLINRKPFLYTINLKNIEDICISVLKGWNNSVKILTYLFIFT